MENYQQLNYASGSNVIYVTKNFFIPDRASKDLAQTFSFYDLLLVGT